MSVKTISFERPKANADCWVSYKAPNSEPLKRFTVDLPAGLHRRIKSQCASSGETMSEAVRRLLEHSFAGDDAP